MSAIQGDTVESNGKVTEQSAEHDELRGVRAQGQIHRSSGARIAERACANRDVAGCSQFSIRKTRLKLTC